MLSELAREARLARVAAGLSQAEVGRAIGVSREAVSRFERDANANPGVLFLARMFRVLGMSLTARAWPDGSPRRDAAHAAVLSAFAQLLHQSVPWRTEVTFPKPGDRRAWDAVASIGSIRIGVEAETRPRDGQDLQRRLNAKRRDGAVDHVVLLLSDTRWNRAFLRSWWDEIRVDLPGTSSQILEALGSGRDPGMSGVVLVKIGGARRRHPAA
jgi:transcriptional regulator with XRE-family HTH domain